MDYNLEHKKMERITELNKKIKEEKKAVPKERNYYKILELQEEADKIQMELTIEKNNDFNKLKEDLSRKNRDGKQKRFFGEIRKS